MGRDNHPKARQLAREEHKAARRESYARILIVSEGKKTEPLYFEEIRAKYRLHSANVQVQHCQIGTAPIQVVVYAEQLFRQGDLHKGIRPKSFDQIYAVFDRDDHASYFDALKAAASLDGKLVNDAKQPVIFKAVASVPSFELWLLLHYEDIQAPIHRDEVMHRLKQHFDGYDKGTGNAFNRTNQQIAIAAQRAKALAEKFGAEDGRQPYTGIFELVALLTTLRN
jgi:hypothetical protein